MSTLEAHDAEQAEITAAHEARPKNFNHETAHFTGTSTYYKHFIPGLQYTDGVKYIADTYGAHWLIDVIFSHVACTAKARIAAKAGHPLTCTLTVKNEKALFEIKDEYTAEIVARQNINFTDFPAHEQVILFRHGVAFLPTED